MNREEIYEAWVPQTGSWSLWARPVLFGQMGPGLETGGEQPWLSLPIDWAPTIEEKAALILDLPGVEGVYLGLACAVRGYRPVPLYNGCTGPSELLDQVPLLRALREGAVFLAARGLASDTPPAFLLDSRRQSLPTPLRPGMLDNRWQVFPEDLPSAHSLRERGITRVIWVGYGRPEYDLARVLRVWQEAQVTLQAKNLAIAGPPQPLAVPRTPWWRRLLNHLRPPRPRDGYGYIVPERTHG
jgi:hypothetical protein